MRRYHKWTENPEGTKEDRTHCIVEVGGGVWFCHHQCRRKRGYGEDGLFCYQHYKMIERGRHLFIPKEKEEVK